MKQPWADPVQIIIILSVYFFSVHVKYLCAREPCSLRKHSSFNLRVYRVIQSERSRLNKWHWAFAESLLFVAWRKIL